MSAAVLTHTWGRATYWHVSDQTAGRNRALRVSTVNTSSPTGVVLDVDAWTDGMGWVQVSRFKTTLRRDADTGDLVQTGIDVEQAHRAAARDAFAVLTGVAT